MGRMSEKITIDTVYDGLLSEVLTEYVDFKRSVGNDYIKEAKHFKRFDTFSKSFNFPKNTLTKELVLAWIEKKSHEKHLNQLKRANTIKQFAYFMRERGYEAYIDPHKTANLSQPYIPYIFTEEQMYLLLSLADKHPKAKSSKNLDLIVPLVFRLLYGCGMRISEVLNLKISDVDTENALIYISKSKFGKGRTIPIAQSLALRCKIYKEKLFPIILNEDNHFIQNPNGQKYSNNTIYCHFRTLLNQAQIPHRGKGQGPRLHDIRHTFAVHSLKKNVLKGKDIRAMLPALSAYMGHCDLRGTQIYLKLTPEMFPNITDSMNVLFSDEGDFL